VTLVYGLGFGMILVLIVVPSLIVIQSDVKRYFVALRHASGAKHVRVKRMFTAAVTLIFAWLAVTLGAVIVTDELPAVIQKYADMFGLSSGAGSALALFLLGAILIVIVLTLVTHAAQAMTWVRQRRT